MNANITADQLYKSILYRAADIYEVDYEDVERDIGDQFDPIIRFMSGALASELERVYDHLYDTESRLQQRLAKVLLPEYYHLPLPAHSMAKAKASSESFMISEKTEFFKEFEEEEKLPIPLSPVFPSRIVPGEVKLIATDSHLIEVKHRPRIKRRGRIGRKAEVKKILIGIESPEPIDNWRGATLFFDLLGGEKTEVEKTLFFAAIRNSRVIFHGQNIKTLNGLPQNELLLEDYLNGNERLQSSVRNRYQHHFLTLLEDEVNEVEPASYMDVLPAWFGSVASDQTEEDDEEKEEDDDDDEKDEKRTLPKLDKLRTSAKDKLYWVEIRLSKPVEISQLLARLSVRLNVFPVVQRRLNGQEKGGHHYLRNNSIKWVSLQCKEDFLAIREVYEEKPPEYPTYLYKPFAEFQEERKPSYTVRYGGVGRWDDFNAWKRLAYIITVLQDNYKHNELIEQAAASLSLEDVHHLLGKKIYSTLKDQIPTQDIYVLLHAGLTTNVRVRVEYWTSIGEDGNGISAKSKLTCKSKDKANFDNTSIAMVSTTEGGRNPLNSTEQLNAMKASILSRGRIVTREDVKVHCQNFLKEKLVEVKVQDGVGTDPRFDFGMTRLLDVFLKPSQKSMKEDWEGICRQVQESLEQNSTSSIPIRVRLMK